MAFYSAIRDGRPSLHPGDFLKPPFHKYLSLALARIPAYGVGKLLSLSEITQQTVNLLAARMLTVLLFLAQIVLVYIIVQRFFGLYAARIVCLTYATSAGFIAFSHFLTADIPVTTWMLAAIYFAQGVLLRGRLTDYLLAGTFTGIAAATKYNGLAIGIVLVVAHARASDWRSWVGVVFDRRLILGLAAVPLAFIIANPYIHQSFHVQSRHHPRIRGRDRRPQLHTLLDLRHRGHRATCIHLAFANGGCWYMVCL
jgi:4-amino-4-deoxy-L-arabinose transferase-like glycosyltransferase